MGNKSNSNSFSQAFTGIWQTIQAQVHFPVLKANAKVPSIYVKNGQEKRPQVYPLLGDRYIIGRSSKNCDIVIRSPIISQTHCVIERDENNPLQFIIKDLNSTNGVYCGGKRYQSLNLFHNDLITLGPPELAEAIEIRYDKSPANWVLFARYGLLSTSVGLLLILGFMVLQWSQYQVHPIPDHTGGSTVVYAEDGKTLLSPRIESPHRELESLKEFSPYLPQALLASEDSRYYWHFGVDPLGIIRAVLVNQEGGRQGASTITQQLARSLYPAVGRENNLARKWREMVVATKLEAIYSKDTILKTYMNRVYLGINLYGFEDAAQFYFDKSARELDINESATLVAILPAPNAYNPVQDYDTAVNLRNRVIARMENLGMISNEEASQARRSRIEISPKARQTLSQVIAPYYYSYVFQEMRELLGDDLTQEGDFIIETSLNPKIQTIAEESLKNHIDSNGKSHNFSQGAIASLNSKNGEIIALVGGKDFNESQFNRATMAQRQPGSTFKVFAYSAALESGISASKTYSCAPLLWQGFQYKACERTGGATNMTQALAQSENSVALRVAKDVGLSSVVNMAKKLGVESPLNPVPGLILGQSEVNLLEITGAYTAFANQGIWSKPHAIKVIRDGRDCEDFDNHTTCREVYRFNETGDEQKQAIKKTTAETMNRMLQQVTVSGTGRTAYLGKQEAGKTGTTNKGVDLWFIGYVPKNNILTGVWLGNDDNSPTNSSSSQAALLWGNYMKKIL
ncbi:PBP1A family penicillin-binding protein [Cyanobacterium aponinum UTEX 3222]|uniref:FHA modulated glycosyl transferase/transpeptidase n=2 Tax=Cyanobacterium aponinum TaxID=379064 RepID=K9Z4W3_CYAAP|nr:PBP1A family penicillin-binding protein [Cyanobacterium aponinum]AFZ53453.1 FHA modulated glycosyl transferase/transpeptidase [Cyanobacterium aponinum PCC 10605]MTF38543.1 PBP1A family penicillin-binding protein [Cyanobacterium aponinum 0216]WRL37844.1 PBP1A family penicillin-binding protein [Cyanobacterium aponinum UTEX 3221]WRL41676.1 PBP1A family penicillin-binding protein [Cyanobacterium aponinum UTEX 3222]